jgi:7-cyano-7-deazaguanine reductase
MTTPTLPALFLAPQTFENIKIVPRQLAQTHTLSGSTTRLLLGSDVINVYDFVYLSARGKPEPAILKITIPCESPYLLEHGSLRTYLDLYSQEKFASTQAIQDQLKHDLSRRVWAQNAIMSSVSIQLIASQHFDAQQIEELTGVDLDRIDIDYPNPEQSALVTAALDEQPVSETLTSRLLSLQGVDDRAIWANLQISYTGPQIEQTSLLFFILSLQQQSLLPEQALELIFNTIQNNAKPTKLAVYAKFARQQQLEINSFRANYPVAAPAAKRCARQ